VLLKGLLETNLEIRADYRTLIRGHKTETGFHVVGDRPATHYSISAIMIKHTKFLGFSNRANGERIDYF
jgi:hypothetical protein